MRKCVEGIKLTVREKNIHRSIHIPGQNSWKDLGRSYMILKDLDNKSWLIMQERARSCKIMQDLIHAENKNYTRFCKYLRKSYKESFVIKKIPAQQISHNLAKSY